MFALLAACFRGGATISRHTPVELSYVVPIRSWTSGSVSVHRESYTHRSVDSCSSPLEAQKADFIDFFGLHAWMSTTWANPKPWMEARLRAKLGHVMRRELASSIGLSQWLLDLLRAASSDRAPLFEDGRNRGPEERVADSLRDDAERERSRERIPCQPQHVTFSHYAPGFAGPVRERRKLWPSFLRLVRRFTLYRHRPDLASSRPSVNPRKVNSFGFSPRLTHFHGR